MQRRFPRLLLGRGSKPARPKAKASVFYGAGSSWVWNGRYTVFSMGHQLLLRCSQREPKGKLRLRRAFASQGLCSPVACALGPMPVLTLQKSTPSILCLTPTTKVNRKGTRHATGGCPGHHVFLTCGLNSQVKENIQKLGIYTSLSL